MAKVESSAILAAVIFVVRGVGCGLTCTTTSFTKFASIRSDLKFWLRVIHTCVGFNQNFKSFCRQNIFIDVFGKLRVVLYCNFELIAERLRSPRQTHGERRVVDSITAWDQVLCYTRILFQLMVYVCNLNVHETSAK